MLSVLPEPMWHLVQGLPFGAPKKLQSLSLMHCLTPVHAAGQRRGDGVDEAVGGRLAAFMRQRVAQLSAARDRERVRVWWSS